MQTTIETVKTQTPAAKTITRDTFGTGRYSNAAYELFNDSIRLLKIAPEQAERLAKAHASEMGRMQAGEASISIGNASKKDMTCTLRETVKLKGVRFTYALSLAKLCVMLDDAKRYGVESYGITLTQEHRDWLDGKKPQD